MMWSVANVEMLPIANVANYQFIRRLVHRSISEGGSLGEGG